MNNFTKKKLHAEVLERIADFLKTFDEDLDTDFDYYNDRLSQDEEKSGYNYLANKNRIEEINEKSKFIDKVLEHLEKIQL